MMRVQEKLSRAVACLEFFTTHEWRFSNANVVRLAGELSPKDREMFNFDMRSLQWPLYMEQYVLGTRRFLLKDDPSTFPAARRHLRKYV
jgi:alcohol-forming fatty acyl-CoA reductase